MLYLRICSKHSTLQNARNCHPTGAGGGQNRTIHFNGKSHQDPRRSLGKAVRTGHEDGPRMPAMPWRGGCFPSTRIWTAQEGVPVGPGHPVHPASTCTPPAPPLPGNPAYPPGLGLPCQDAPAGPSPCTDGTCLGCLIRPHTTHIWQGDPQKHFHKAPPADASSRVCPALLLGAPVSTGQEPRNSLPPLHAAP